MEIDVKEEQKRVQSEMAQLSSQIDQADKQLAFLQQQRQQLINALLEKSGEIKLLNRLDGKKKLDEKDIRKVAEQVSKK